MIEQRLGVYRDGNRAVLADVVDDPDYKGVVNWTWLSPETAISLGEAMAAIGREIIAEAKP